MMRRIASAIVLALITSILLPSSSAQAATAGQCGIDWAWYEPTNSQLNATGCKVAARYILPSGMKNGKDITSSERARIHGLGWEILTVYETAANRALGGRAAGVTDARRAITALEELGAPLNQVVYFAADWDVTSAQVPVWLAYLEGAASVLGWNQVGAYGGYRATWTAANRGVKYLWQTYAWSRGQWDARACFRQVRNGYYWNGQGDRNTVNCSTVGTWAPGYSSPVPVPPPAPTPPAQGSKYTVVRGDTLSGIASRFGTTYQEIARCSGIVNPNRIYVGQVVTIRCAATAPKTPTVGKFYTVKRGDTLGAIARKYNTSVSKLMSINRGKIKNANRIYPGQRIRIR